jgi:predicted dithiol-disulfide oxidoreductase (DUF899 family)
VRVPVASQPGPSPIGHHDQGGAGRGVEALGSTWTFLDLTPLGRQEDWEDSPKGSPQSLPYLWWRRLDEYSE